MKHYAQSKITQEGDSEAQDNVALELLEARSNSTSALRLQRRYRHTLISNPSAIAHRLLKPWQCLLGSWGPAILNLLLHSFGLMTLKHMLPKPRRVQR